MIIYRSGTCSICGIITKKTIDVYQADHKPLSKQCIDCYSYKMRKDNVN